MGNKKKGKILAVLLSGALLGTQIPTGAAAEGAAGYTGGICGHHPAHTEECGYQEAVPEQPCLHVHTEECYEYVINCVHEHTQDCYPLEAAEASAEEQDTEETEEDAEKAAEPGGTEPADCTHVCSEESGCVTKNLDCIHVDKANADGSVTYAVHNESCGYAPAVEAQDCTFVCEICSAPETREEGQEESEGADGYGEAGGTDDLFNRKAPPVEEAGYTFENGVLTIISNEGLNAFGGLEFAKEDIKEVLISDGVTGEVASEVFSTCSNLTKVVIGKGVTSIGSRAFGDNMGLGTVILPETAPVTAEDSFDWSSWTNFIIPEGSIGTGGGKYDLNARPWNQIQKLNGMSVENGKYVIDSVDVLLEEPEAEQALPDRVTCETANGVTVTGSITWISGSETAEAGTTAEYGTEYTAEVTLSADAEAAPIGYKFTDSTTVTWNGKSVMGATVKDDGTLTFAQAYKTKEPAAVVTFTGDEATQNYASLDEAFAAAKGKTAKEATCTVTVNETTISNKEGKAGYSTAFIHGDPIPEPKQDNFTIDGVGDGFSGQWYSGDHTTGKLTEPLGKTPDEAGTYTLVVTTEGNGTYAAGELRLPVTVADAEYDITIPASAQAGGEEVSITKSGTFKIGSNGKVRVTVSDGAPDGKITLTRKDDGTNPTTVTSELRNGKDSGSLLKNGSTVALYDASGNLAEGTGKLYCAAPEPTVGTDIPVGTYEGNVTFQISYEIQQEGSAK